MQNGSDRPRFVYSARGSIRAGICLAEQFTPRVLNGTVQRQEASLLAYITLLQR